MASARQTAANGRNARKSTGPRSQIGKARSSRNALKHGLTARQVLLPDEDPDAFDALRQAMIDNLDPEDALQEQLVDLAVSLFWRLRRVPGLEVALFEWVQFAQVKMHDSHSSIPEFDYHSLEEDPLVDDSYRGRARPDILELGRTVFALLNQNATTKLNRYETALHRQLDLTFKQLEDLKAKRLDLSKLVDVSAKT